MVVLFFFLLQMFNMPIYCCVHGCNSMWLQNGQNNQSFFRFPYSRPLILKKWVANIRRANWKPSIAFRICGKHFSKKAFYSNTWSSAKTLRSDAIPTLFNVSMRTARFTRTASKRKRLKEYSPKNQTLSLTVENVDTNYYKDSDSDDTRSDVTEKDDKNLNKTLLYLKVRALRARLRWRDKKITSMKAMLAELNEHNNIAKDALNTLHTYFDGFPLELLLNKENSYNKEYTDKIREFVLTLYLCSPRVYHYVRALLNLPEVATVQSWSLGVRNCDQHLLNEILHFLKEELPHINLKADFKSTFEQNYEKLGEE